MGARDKTGKTLQRLNTGKGQTGGRAGEAETEGQVCAELRQPKIYKVLRKKGQGCPDAGPVVQVEASSGRGRGAGC